MKSNERLIEAKKILIVDYLSSLGFNFLRQSNNYYYYLSPLPGRNEKHPSFLIRKKDNKWSDRGKDSRWSDLIDLVMVMNNSDFNKSIDIILGQDTLPKIENLQDVKEEKPSIIIDEIKEITSQNLVKELIRRKVNIDIARKYCKEAVIRFPNNKYKPEKKINIIAFKNDLGGYEFRNKYLKRSNSPKYFTTITGTSIDKNFLEGFMDFLSLLTYYKIDKPINTTYVLNSLVYLRFLYPEMLKPGINYMYLNWGNAACSKYNELIENNIPFKDCRDLYYLYDDINDMLRNYARIK